MLDKFELGVLKFILSVFTLITIFTLIIMLIILGLFPKDCKAQSSYPDYQQSTQGINNQYHQLEMDRQQRQLMQHQFIQQQQLDQTRRDAEYNIRQSNRDINSESHHKPFRY